MRIRISHLGVSEAFAPPSPGKRGDYGGNESRSHVTEGLGMVSEVRSGFTRRPKECCWRGGGWRLRPSSSQLES